MKQLWLCCLFLLSAVGCTRDFSAQFPCHKQAEYFDFYYFRESPKISASALFADDFVKLLRRDFFRTDFGFPISVLVLKDQAQFKRFLVQQLDITNPPSYGIYIPFDKILATHEDAGLGTLTHEIVYPLAHRNLRRCPPWAMTAIATFFEKFYGYREDGKLTVYWGYQNPWRIQQLGTNLTRLNLEKTISGLDESEVSGAVERGQSGRRLAAVFLWQQGRFKRFLNLITAHNTAGYHTYFEAAMEMPIEKIKPVWQKYLNEIAAQRAQIMLLPPSQIFDSQTAFQTFVEANNISVVQPKQVKGD